MTNPATKAFNQSSESLSVDRPLLFFIRNLLYPITAIGALVGNFLYYQVSITGIYFLFFVFIFILSIYVLDVVHLYRSEKNFPWLRSLLDIMARWMFILITVWLVFSQSGFGYIILEPAIYTWAMITPIILFSLQAMARFSLIFYFKKFFKKRNAVIVCVDKLGLQLLKHNRDDLFSEINFLGFFENRSRERLPKTKEVKVLGTTKDLPDFINNNDVQIVYIALPMAHQPRVMELLDSIRDSTVSIYFVPDLFITDLIQARFDHVGGVPVVAVCETPFYGFRSIQKRTSDFVLALIISIGLIPFFIIIALGIKLTSKGPVLFKQLRYGLDGKEIWVYKFRSMTVTENGANVKQATRNDSRITPFGGFLRKTSLDELPQFINVLQGRMSIVGPRPHAVAHNELYRQIIKGYMIRHKVKPGITGWAQVNGLRGETDSLDKMAQRIEYDLDYLRNWSLGLDLQIILKTVGVVVGDKNAY